MAGNISADYLFHFTNRFENLLSILKEGYFPNYCLENWLTIDEKLPHIGIPMVCFCDIPELFIEPHKNKYGPYGIAMEKSWGIEKRITPITYVHKDSFNYTALQTIWKTYEENKECIKRNDFVGEKDIMGMKAKTYRYGTANHFEEAFHSLLFLFKPYFGDDFSGKGVCFYDEREWRFYPFRVTPSYLSEGDYYKNDEGKLKIHPIFWETYVNNLKTHYRLDTPLSSVKGIYVQTNEEKEKIINEFGNSLFIKVQNPEECDATNDDSSNTVGLIKKYL
jgi:hypothetical protein